MTGTVSVKIIDDFGGIKVKTTINFDKPIMRFSFELGNMLNIDSIEADVDISWETTCDWVTRPITHAAKEIEIKAKSAIRELIIEYHGQPKGWLTAIEERRVSLTAHSVWTIARTSEEIKFTYNYEIPGNYRIWNPYGGKHFYALKEGAYYLARYGDFSVFYFNTKDKAYADYCARYYGEAVENYTAMFGKIGTYR